MSELKAIQDPTLGKAGQDVWFLIKPPAEHSHRTPALLRRGFLLALTLHGSQAVQDILVAHATDETSEVGLGPLVVGVSSKGGTHQLCALALLQRLKAFRAKGLASKAGEFSTANAVWRVLSRSGYIAKVKEKVNQLKTDFYKMKVKKPSMLTNDDYRLFVNTVPGINTIPTSIVTWNKRIMKGGNPEAFIKRASPFLELFDDKYDGTN